MKISLDKILKEAGLRATKQRLDIIEILLEYSTTPLSIEELVEMLPEGFDKVTAYRVINVFYEKGIVEKINHLTNNLKVMIAPHYKKSHQHIITCRICGTIVTANICVQVGWRDKLVKKGFKDLSHNLSFTGVCADECSAQS